MNTLGGTDEGRARPSVWPVYVVAVVILVVGLWLLFQFVDHLSFLVSEGIPLDLKSDLLPLLLCVSIGLFGWVTAWGLVWLRSWGWWCAAVWAGIFAVGLVSLGFGCLDLWNIGETGPLFFFIVLVAPLGLVAIVLLIRLLESRRQLFFPPKPAGEE